MDYFYLCHFKATLTSYCAQTKIQSQECVLRKVQNSRLIKNVLNRVILKVYGINLLTIRTFSICSSLPLILFLFSLNFYCFITTRFLSFWILLPWKGQYIAKYLKFEWTLACQCWISFEIMWMEVLSFAIVMRVSH